MQPQEFISLFSRESFFFVATLILLYVLLQRDKKHEAYLDQSLSDNGKFENAMENVAESNNNIARALEALNKTIDLEQANNKDYRNFYMAKVDKLEDKMEKSITIGYVNTQILKDHIVAKDANTAKEVDRIIEGYKVEADLELQDIDREIERNHKDEQSD